MGCKNHESPSIFINNPGRNPCPRWSGHGHRSAAPHHRAIAPAPAAGPHHPPPLLPTPPPPPNHYHRDLDPNQRHGSRKNGRRRRMAGEEDRRRRPTRTDRANPCSCVGLQADARPGTGEGLAPRSGEPANLSARCWAPPSIIVVVWGGARSRSRRRGAGCGGGMEVEMGSRRQDRAGRWAFFLLFSPLYRFGSDLRGDCGCNF